MDIGFRFGPDFYPVLLSDIMQTVPNTTYDFTGKNISETVILTSGVIWKGGHWTGTGAAFSSNGNCIGASISNVTLDPSMDYLLEGNNNPFVTYDGQDKNFLYKNLLVDGVIISGKTRVYNGTWEGPKTYHNVCFGLTVNNLTRTYDANSGNLLVFGNSIYKFKANNWTLKGDSQTGLVDNGVIQIQSGNGQLKNFYRRGKQDGYIGRFWGAKIGTDPDQDIYIENCVDAETVVYGTMDIRIDPSLLQSNAAIPISAPNGYFYQNTSANKSDMNNGYVTNAVIVGALKDDLGIVHSISIKNNVAFGAWVSGMSGNSSLVKDNSGGQATIILLNNSDTPPGQPMPPGLVDANYYGLTPIGAQAQAPVVPAQRCAVSLVIAASKATVTYDDGSVSSFTLKNPVSIS